MIRRARQEEADAIAELYARSFATLTYLPVLHTLEQLKSWLGGVVAEREVWVWYDDSLAGFIALSDDELLLLYLEPERTGHGIGARLLARAKERRPNGFHLWTFQQNAGARRFYERHGLLPVEYGDGSGNEEGVPDVRYEWQP